MSTGEGDGESRGTWFGYSRSIALIGRRSVTVVSPPSTLWSEDHRRRLLRTSTIDGLIPTLGLKRSGDRLDAYQPRAVGRTLASSLEDSAVSGFDEVVGVVIAAANAIHTGHLAGLVHGAVSLEDIHLDGGEVAVSGMGLGWNGVVESDRHRVAAPEVVAGENPTVRSDVYSLGVVLEVALVRSGGPTPADAAALIAEATADEPAGRPPSARALVERLNGLHRGRRSTYKLAPVGSAPSTVALREALVSKYPPDGGSTDTDPPAVALGSGAEGSVVELPSGSESETVAGGGGSRSTSEVSASGGTEASPDATRRRRLAMAASGVAGLIGVGLFAGWALDNGDGAARLSTTQLDDGDAVTRPSALGASTVRTTSTEETNPPEATSPSSPPSSVGAVSGDDGTSEATGGATGSVEGSDSAQLTAMDAASSFEILHAVPDLELDAYVDGQLAATGFGAGTVAGPLPISMVGQPLDLFMAQSDPPSSVDDRNDEPILAGPITMDGPGTLVAFVDDDGSVMLQAFANNLDPIPAGAARLALRHVASVGDASIEVDGKVVAELVPAGSSVVADVVAGPHDVRIVASDGSELLNQQIDVVEGELTSAWIRGGGDRGAMATSVRRIAGLQTAPNGIPSGDSGLAGEDDDSARAIAVSVGLMIAMGTSGAWLQRRNPSLDMMR